MKRSGIKRVGKSATSKLQKKCDKLLSPILIDQHPVCLLNGDPDNPNCTYHTNVAHHHIHKASSNRLRYDMDNLINLCSHCHFMLHQNESYWASKIVDIKGVEWFNALEIKKREIIKTNKAYYEGELERLQNILVDK